VWDNFDTISGGGESNDHVPINAAIGLDSKKITKAFDIE